MKYCARSWSSPLKETVSRVLRTTAIAVARPARKENVLQAFRKLIFALGCAALIFFAQPALAQRGGGHAGGGFGGGHFGGGGRASGGRSFAGSRAGGGMRSVSGGRSGRGWSHPGYSGARGGIEVFSGSDARGGSGFVSDAGSAGDEVRDGIVSYSGAPRHSTIGFPRTGGEWRVPESINRSGAPLDFAGQGHSVWESSPLQTSGRGAAGERTASTRSPDEEQWPIGRDHGHHDHDHFHRFRRGFYSRSGYGYFGYPWLYLGYGAYGLGWSNCDQCDDCANLDWESDWESQYDENCEPQDQSIVAYGADGSYAAPQDDTKQIYGPYAEGNYGSQYPEAQNSDSASLNGASGSAMSSETGQLANNSESQKPDALLYLADGTNYAVSSYWLAGGELHYMTSYGAEDEVPLGRVDLQRTVDANAARGMPFTLRPAPGRHSGAVVAR